MTVAIPTCNGAAHVAEAIRGILAQQGVEFELVIADDRSDDETLAIVRTTAGDRRSDRGQFRAPGPGRQLESMRGPGPHAVRVDLSSR